MEWAVLNALMPSKSLQNYSSDIALNMHVNYTYRVQQDTSRAPKLVVRSLTGTVGQFGAVAPRRYQVSAQERPFVEQDMR